MMRDKVKKISFILLNTSLDNVDEALCLWIKLLEGAQDCYWGELMWHSAIQSLHFIIHLDA